MNNTTFVFSLSGSEQKLVKHSEYSHIEIRQFCGSIIVISSIYRKREKGKYIQENWFLEIGSNWRGRKLYLLPRSIFNSSSMWPHAEWFQPEENKGCCESSLLFIILQFEFFFFTLLRRSMVRRYPITWQIFFNKVLCWLYHQAPLAPSDIRFICV